MNTLALNMYVFLSNTGLTRRNTLFVCLWLRPRNTLTLTHNAPTFLHIIIGSVLYPWVNCTGIRTLNPGVQRVTVNPRIQNRPDHDT